MAVTLGSGRPVLAVDARGRARGGSRRPDERPSIGPVNRLADETSPYLRQHADNPVDWQPWGEAPFAEARRRDVPVFLSIGYSSCHWCHVMAHESFEDAAVAGLLNAHFVPVKVDREERPDVDAVYLEAVQALTGSGGWPLSVFLTPDRQPFFGGTYFPPRDRPGLPSFTTVLAAVADAWGTQRGDVLAQAEELTGAVVARTTLRRSGTGRDGTDVPRQASAPPGTLLRSAVEALSRSFDPEHGGFGTAPKFPQPGLVEVLLNAAARHGAGSPVATAEHMAVATLDALAAGGVHDHLGGGFARYATDAAWSVPHFEKMLYDQAGLLRAFLHGWQVTGRPAYRWVVGRIVAYVLAGLAHDAGGLCAAEDADSEGAEGRFYVWTPDEIATALADAPAGTAGPDVVAAFFGVTTAGTFEAGTSVLRRQRGAPLTGPPDVEAARALLAQARARRVRPARDDKVVTEWNAMFVSALAEAAGATGEGSWASAAVAVATALVEHARRDDGRWLRSWLPGGPARHLACAGDYAWLVDAFTRLGELTGDASWTALATETADDLLERFLDTGGGGFFTTGHDADPLIARAKDVLDGAVPAANGTAALALVRLGALTGAARFTEAAAGVVDLAADLLERHPTAVTTTLLAAELLAGGTTEVVVPGRRRDLVEVVQRRWVRDGVLAWGEPTGSPLFAERDAGVAYVCRGSVCTLPVADPDALARKLDEVAS